MPDDKSRSQHLAADRLSFFPQLLLPGSWLQVLMRVARDDAPVSWSAAARYAEPSASDAPFSARPSSPTFSPTSWRPSSSLSWLPYNQLHWWSETPGRSPGGAAGAVPFGSGVKPDGREPKMHGLFRARAAEARSHRAREFMCAGTAAAHAHDLGAQVSAPGTAVWNPVEAGITSHSRRRENQPERWAQVRRPSRLTEAAFAP